MEHLQGFRFDFEQASGGFGNGRDITTDGTHLWLMSGATPFMKFTPQGTYTRVGIDSTSGTSGGADGGAWKDGKAYIIDEVTEKVFEFAAPVTPPYVGQIDFMTDADSGLPLYERVK